MNQQPNFTTKDNAIASTDFDKMSDEELQKLINATHQLKTGRQGRVHTTPPPAEKRHIDLDALIKQYGSQ